MRSLHPTLRTLSLILATVAFLWQSPVGAQMAGGNDPYGGEEPKRRPPDSSMTVRVYEVTDLVAQVPDYEYSQAADKSMGRGSLGGLSGGGSLMPGGVAGMGGGFGSDTGMMPGQASMGSPGTAAPPGISIADLVTAITHTCGGTTWQEDGGSGAVEVLGYSLVVLQTEDVHKQIQALLDQLRRGSGKRKTVSIDARWLVLSSDDLELLTPADPQGTPQVDSKVLAGFTRRPTSIRAMTKCFSGQLVYLVSGTRQNIVTGVIPVVGSIDRPDGHGAQYARRDTLDNPFMFVSQREGVVVDPSEQYRSVGYQSVTEKWNFGAALEIRPTLVPGKDSAIVDLRSTITALAKPTAVLAAQPPQPTGAPQVDRVAIDTQELATTLSLALERPVLIGGLTRVASAKPEAALAVAGTPSAPPVLQETPQLYLILELRAEAED